MFVSFFPLKFATMPEGPSTVEQAFENLNAFLKTEDGIEVAKKVHLCFSRNSSPF